MEKLKSGAEKLGLSLNKEQIEKFEIYYREVADWNQRVNLTSITGYEETQLNHFLDSLTLTLAMKKPFGNDNPRIIDIGAGAGLPGIPLKIIYPEIRLTLLDSTAKKTGFLNHIAGMLQLEKVEIITARAEEAAHREEYRQTFDTVISRGVAPLVTLAELTLPFCKIGGSFIAQKKGYIKQELEGAENSISILGGKLREVKRIDLSEFPDQRCLVIIDKIAATPGKYPRRPGMPAKRPIT
ncbi:16S rRNA (guanine(527)-N(7))-methyltransferase RsmG [Chloroflexota bacterium]